MTKVGGKQGYTACEIVLFQQIIFFISIQCHADHNNCHQVDIYLTTLYFWILLDLKQSDPSHRIAIGLI